MKGMTRIALIATAVSLASLLAGCENFDPTNIFDAEIFNTKKKLPGERKPVFPEGTPGVSQGVPAELVKGYQPTQEPEQVAAPAEPKPEAKPKPKPKPKVAAKPKVQPAAASAQPAPQPQPSQAQTQQQWPAPPPSQAQSQSQPQWPSPPSQQQQSQSTGGGGVAWPDPPSATR